MDDKEQFYKEFYSALEKIMEPSGGHSIEMEALSRYSIENITRDAAATHLYAAVVGYENNKDWLKNIPHERIADLAVFAKWKFDHADRDSVVSTKVTEPLLAYLQLTKEEALKIAKTNTARSARFEGMEVIMNEALMNEGMDKEMADLMAREFGFTPFRILTNESTIGGAAVIACPEVLNAVQKQIGEDFYILPSSIHEVLILPKSHTDDVEGLKQMVSSINEAEVSPEERLSDNVYEFDGHSLKIAGSELTQEKQKTAHELIENLDRAVLKNANNIDISKCIADEPMKISSIVDTHRHRR